MWLHDYTTIFIHILWIYIFYRILQGVVFFFFSHCTHHYNNNDVFFVTRIIIMLFECYIFSILTISLWHRISRGFMSKYWERMAKLNTLFAWIKYGEENRYDAEEEIIVCEVRLLSKSVAATWGSFYMNQWNNYNKNYSWNKWIHTSPPDWDKLSFIKDSRLGGSLTTFFFYHEINANLS